MQILQVQNLQLPFNVPEILQFGVVGLGAIMAILAYVLLKAEQARNQSRSRIIKAIYVFMAFAIALTILGLYSESEKNNGKGTIAITYNQSTIPNISGYWAYVCTANNGKYYHGGRFIAKQHKNGHSWDLVGERMWLDTLNTSTNKWTSINYPMQKPWKSTWGSIDEKEIRFEYSIANVSGQDVKGYASANMKTDSTGKILRANGMFYQLYPAKQLSGEIKFFRINEEQFDSPTWDRSHLDVQFEVPKQSDPSDSPGST